MREFVRLHKAHEFASALSRPRAASLERVGPEPFVLLPNSCGYRWRSSSFAAFFPAVFAPTQIRNGVEKILRNRHSVKGLRQSEQGGIRRKPA